MLNEPQDTTSWDARGWFDNIISHAIQKRASDIHLEPERDTFNIRFRVDGILQNFETLNKYFQDKVVSMVKVMSNMNITERRLPQDGHFEYNYEGRIRNFRVSVFPCLYGEAIVLRILSRDDLFLKVENLGFLPDQLELVDKLITSSSGMILATGPTGSGKTNLLYSIMHVLSRPERNIIALEDPIEYQLGNIRQTQIDGSIGLTYSNAMRFVVRQDPDIIMLGEIRDSDTGQMAVQAALTGILIFSTFHTFDVPGLITRFLEFGVTNSMVAQTIKGIISTRLIRMVCGSCKEPYQIREPEKLDSLVRNLLERQAYPKNFQRGRGCNKCSNSGYLGRTGVFEIVYFDEEIKASLMEETPLSLISEIIRSKKTRGLREAALEKVFQGITTFEEVTRVLGVQIK